MTLSDLLGAILVDRCVELRNSRTVVEPIMAVNVCFLGHSLEEGHKNVRHEVCVCVCVCLFGGGRIREGVGGGGVSVSLSPA